MFLFYKESEFGRKAFVVSVAMCSSCYTLCSADGNTGYNLWHRVGGWFECELEV